MIESHSQLLLSMEKWVEQDNTLLGMTNEVDYDQDGNNAYFNYNISFTLVSAYSQLLEDMIEEKLDELNKLKEKTRAFRYICYMCLGHLLN